MSTPTSGTNPTTFPVVRAAGLPIAPAGERWLVQNVWGRTAVGLIGGAPKCCKSWFGLDLAVSVASGTPCLGRFPVDAKGPALVYLAEDALPLVRERIEAICASRNLPIALLDLHVITSATIRLDLPEDQARLVETVRTLKPRLVVLDPLVRLHRGDENNAMEMARLLGFLREIERTHHVAIVLVHHANKRPHAQLGQTLRGSSDLHAFGDSNAYLNRVDGHLQLTLEHRSALPPEPMYLSLVSRPDGTATHLEVVDSYQSTIDLAMPPAVRDLEAEILAVVRSSPTPRTRADMRLALKVRNERLGEALTNLESAGRIERTKRGWTEPIGTVIAPADETQ